jgi:hypothetical protein
MEKINDGQGLTVQLGTDGRNRAVILTIPPAALMGGCEGEPIPGVAMSPRQAREIAHALLMAAERLSGGPEKVAPKGRLDSSNERDLYCGGQ